MAVSAALRNPACRAYLCGGALSMMADNIEHVITYWVIWQRFHSPVLTGFEVFSHWLPFLLLSPYFGALADRDQGAGQGIDGRDGTDTAASMASQGPACRCPTLGWVRAAEQGSARCGSRP